MTQLPLAAKDDADRGGHVSEVDRPVERRGIVLLRAVQGRVIADVEAQTGALREKADGPAQLLLQCIQTGKSFADVKVGDVIDIGVLKTTVLEVGNLVFGRQSTGRCGRHERGTSPATSAFRSAPVSRSRKGTPPRPLTVARRTSFTRR